MRSGDLTAPDRLAVDRAIRAAETRTRFEFSVYVGITESTPRDYSERMHAVLAAPQRSVMIMIDPRKRALFITTGREVRARVADDAVSRIADELAAEFGSELGSDGGVNAIVRAITAIADEGARAGITR